LCDKKATHDLKGELEARSRALEAALSAHKSEAARQKAEAEAGTAKLKAELNAVAHAAEGRASEEIRLVREALGEREEAQKVKLAQVEEKVKEEAGLLCEQAQVSQSSVPSQPWLSLSTPVCACLRG